MGYRKKVYGIGINDVPGSSGTLIYNRWNKILERCYSAKFLKRNPSYIGCKVCEEWLKFSSFKEWIERQDYIGKEIDKDLLVPGNKVYSPRTCVMIEPRVNKLLNGHASARGVWPLGVSRKSKNKFSAQCWDFYSGKHKHLGYFVSPESAHRAYVDYKVSLIKCVADEYPEIKQGMIRHAKRLIDEIES